MTPKTDPPSFVYMEAHATTTSVVLHGDHSPRDTTLALFLDNSGENKDKGVRATAPPLCQQRERAQITASGGVLFRSETVG